MTLYEGVSVRWSVGWSVTLLSAGRDKMASGYCCVYVLGTTETDDRRQTVYTGQCQLIDLSVSCFSHCHRNSLKPMFMLINRSNTSVIKMSASWGIILYWVFFFMDYHWARILAGQTSALATSQGTLCIMFLAAAFSGTNVSSAVASNFSDKWQGDKARHPLIGIV